jgi:hypothetical protein
MPQCRQNYAKLRKIWVKHIAGVQQAYTNCTNTQKWTNTKTKNGVAIFSLKNPYWV